MEKESLLNRTAGCTTLLVAQGLRDTGHAAPYPPDNTWPKITSFPTHDELEASVGVRLEQRIVLLDPEVPNGYVREWSPPGMPPSRHFSYAIQWWGFAAVLLVLYFGLNFRKVS